MQENTEAVTVAYRWAVCRFYSFEAVMAAEDEVLLCTFFVNCTVHSMCVLSVCECTRTHCWHSAHSKPEPRM